ncbi:MAG: Uma2 family endonuclease [Leptolyngbya sp. SIO1D8]|nr:Uma2 family endonuclease [Leptolyngbya sp. SIO1D8]
MTFQSGTLIHYPQSDGQPMTESDPTRDYLTYCVEALELFFRSRRQVYVSGNLFIYYEAGNPKAVVSPDVFVVFGVSKRKRRSYKTWEEGGKAPAFVLEVTSRTTKKQDEITKPQLYAQLGVQEYFQYDPTGDYLTPQLKGFVLVEGQYQPLPLEETPENTWVMSSAALGLDLCLPAPDEAALSVVGREALPRSLRFYDPKTGERLPSYAESIEARDQERERAEQAQERAEQEQLKAQQAQERAEQAEQAQRTAVPKLLAIGLSPEQVAETLGLPIETIRDLS